MAEADRALTDGDLAGRVVLITGGRRVGGDLALLLAARGAHVAMTYHTSRVAIERTIAQVEEGGPAGLAIEADLSTPTRRKLPFGKSSTALASSTRSSTWRASIAARRSIPCPLRISIP